MTGTSPPGPLRCGSTTCKVKAVATAASNALPPFSKIAMPTAVAIQWVEATTPKVPSISGRVVNGLGLIFFAIAGRHFTTARPERQPPGSAHASWLPRQAGQPASGGPRDSAFAEIGCGRGLCRLGRFECGLPSFDFSHRLTHSREERLLRKIAPPAAAIVKLHEVIAPAL